jgi:hypothetical protein
MGATRPNVEISWVTQAPVLAPTETPDAPINPVKLKAGIYNRPGRHSNDLSL